MTVLIVGEALVDLILRTDGSLTAIPGGGPFNAARTIARLDVPAVFVAGLSDDAFGRRLTALLVQDGVETPVPLRSGTPTTLALAELDETGAASYHFYVAQTAAADVREEDLTDELLAQASVLHVGTLGLVLEPVADTIEYAVGAVGDGVLVFVDPNCRPVIISDDAVYRARLARVLARADVVKVSGDDLAYLDPTRPALDVARGLLEQGPSVVLFTDGADSVRILARGGEVTVPVPLVEVVDTVGAGDAFGGGFVAFWVHAGLGRADLGDLPAVTAAVEKAIVVAALTCQRVGADPPHRVDLPF